MSSCAWVSVIHEIGCQENRKWAAFELHWLILPHCLGDWCHCPGQGPGGGGAPTVCQTPGFISPGSGGSIIIPIFQMRTVRLGRIQGLAPGHSGVDPCCSLRCAALRLGIWPEEPQSLTLPWVQREVSAFHTIEIPTATGSW